MELTITMRLRIAAAFVIGAALVGIAAWPWDSPPDTFGSLVAASIGTGRIVILLFMAFISGFIAYFAAWPYGREIAILAAPFGLTVWAIRCGTMAALMRMNPGLEQRLALLSSFRWEPVFWLAVVLSGFGGVVLAQRMCPIRGKDQTEAKSDNKPVNYVNIVLSLVLSVVIAKFFITIFAQDVALFDSKFGSVSAQPPVGQVVFAVFVSFGIAAFVVKLFLNIGYLGPVIATGFITFFTAITYDNEIALNYLANNWPATFFSDSSICVLPVQMVAFGTLGSVAGYWMAIRYTYWRKHELK